MCAQYRQPPTKQKELSKKDTGLSVRFPILTASYCSKIQWKNVTSLLSDTNVPLDL